MAKMRLTRREFLHWGGSFAVSLAERAAFGKKERIKTPEELRVETIVEQTYQRYFREVIVGERKFLLRIPFGQWNERFKGQHIFMGGKGDPESNWRRIEEALEEPSFATYLQDLSQPGKKLILFDLPQETYRIFTGEEEIERIKAQFWGKERYPYKTKERGSLEETDFYDYFYLKRVGIDCSGFSFYFPRMIAFEHGYDLCEEIGRAWGIRPEKVPLFIGTWYYNPKYGCAKKIDDQIINLRPGDLICFPARRWEDSHSAVIQSIDFQRGRLRYIQCTDWVFDRKERGPHDSEIIFDPAFPQTSLSDPSLVWTQRVGPVFESETCPYGNETDEFRYQLPPFKGKVVRLWRIAEILKGKEPLYYANLF